MPVRPLAPELRREGALEALADAAGLTPECAFDTSWAYEFADEQYALPLPPPPLRSCSTSLLRPRGRHRGRHVHGHRAARARGMKPIATVPHALRTVDVATGDTASAHHQRSDVCAVPAAGVVAEAMVAIVLAEVALEKFGGDSSPRPAATSSRTSRTSRRPCAPSGQRRGPRRGMTQPSSRARARRPDGRRQVERRTARRQGPRRGFFDTDIAIVRAHGPIPSSSARTGEGHFRALERDAVREGLATRGVVALGGGAVLDADTRADLAAHDVVLLTVEPRVVADAAARHHEAAAAGRGPDRGVDANQRRSARPCTRRWPTPRSTPRTAR